MSSIFSIRLQNTKISASVLALSAFISTACKNCNEFALNWDFTDLGRKIKSLHLTEAMSYTAVISFLNHVQQLLCIIDVALER